MTLYLALIGGAMIGFMLGFLCGVIAEVNASTEPCDGCGMMARDCREGGKCCAECSH